MNRRTILILCLLSVLFPAVAARADEPLGVFANSNTCCIQFIDPDTQEASAPYFRGKLGSYGGSLFDAVITADGKTCIVSNFGDSKIYFIDISGGFEERPVLRGNCTVPFFAEDLALSPDGKYVLVSGDFSSSQIAIIHVPTRKLRSVKTIGNKNAESVAVASDGTVLVSDNFGQAIHTYALSADGTLIYKRTYSTKPYYPFNVSISPNGQTVLAACCGGILGFAKKGRVLYRKPAIQFVAKPGQSCVFSKDGTKAYYLTSSTPSGTLVQVLNVTGPGTVTPSGTSISIKPPRGSSQLFGVDTIAIDPEGDYLYVTNPTLSGGISSVAIVDLTTNTQVDYIKAAGIPTGIAFTTIPD